MDRDVISCNGLDQFETQKSVMVGRWHILGPEHKHDSVRVLVREAHKCKFE